jgi:predicted enzyme related to lactoylglutathione lyase
MFIRVPERKTAKNRMHIDLGTPDLEAETERVLGLGAELVGRYDEYGTTWATFRDPEGNEFCIGLHDAPQH